VSGNTASEYGGGVYLWGYYFSKFRIVSGTVYGLNEANASLRNTAPNGAALYKDTKDTNGIAERGTLSGSTWISKGDLNTTDNTIKVLNGDIVP